MAPKQMLFCVLQVLTMFAVVSAAGVAPATLSPSIEKHQEAKVTKSHTLDNLNLLIFMFLLSMTVVTSWIFKYRRLRFVHETGLAVIYGLIVGIIIRFGTSSSSSMTIDVNPAINQSVGSPPDRLRLSFQLEKNETVSYLYGYQGESASKENEELNKATFDPEIFFNVLLPPIIFHAGYSLKRRHFFRNFGAITAFAFLGTTISCVVVGGIMYGFTRLMLLYSQNWTTWKMTNFGLTDCLFFGAIISATDPVTILAIFHDLNVDVDMYALVFGESVLNDAVAIVLAGSIEQYKSSNFDGLAVIEAIGTFVGIFIGSFVLGSVVGAMTAVLTKFTKIRDYPLLETTLFFLMSYSSFLAAEATGRLTGIVTVLFCGIAQAHYTYNNLSTESKIWTKQLFHLLNFLAENFVFLYIGISTFSFKTDKWDVSFIFAAFLAIIVGRMCNIYPLSFLLNLGRSNKIKNNYQHMMMFSGLRGAIAFALAIRNTSTAGRQVIFTTTLIIVITTVILCGGLTTQMLQWLKIRVGVEDETEMQNFHPVPGDSDRSRGSTVQLPPESIPDKTWVLMKWYSFDSKFVKPLLTNSRPTLIESLPSCCEPLARFLTTQEQLESDQHIDGDSDTEVILDENAMSIGDGGSSINGSATISANDTQTLAKQGQSISDEGDLGLGINGIRNSSIII